MKFSIIIVSWNAQRYLLECLESIYRSLPAGHDSEVIVVDNASTDGSPEAVSKAYPLVKVIRKENNLGFAKANNIGIKASTGDYLFLINSDVVVAENSLDTLLRYMHQHEEIGVLGPQILDIDGRVQRSCMGYPTLWNTLTRALWLDSLFPKRKVFGGLLLNYWKHDSVREVDVINGCFWLIRRKALETVGLLDERFFIYGEDVDWCKRFGVEGWKVVFYPGARSMHYGGGSSANAPMRFYKEQLKANLQYWKKYNGHVGQASYIVVVALHHAVRVIGYALVAIVSPKRSGQAVHCLKRSYVCLKFLLHMADSPS